MARIPEVINIPMLDAFVQFAADSPCPEAVLRVGK